MVDIGLVTPAELPQGGEPCGFCALSGAIDLTTGTSRCSRCQLVHYCSREHQREHWLLEHKYTCRPANKAVVGLMHELFLFCGLFSNGTNFYAVPCRINTDVAQRALSVVLQGAANPTVEQDLAKEYGHLTSILANPKTLYLSQQPKPTGKVSCRLDQVAAAVHNVWYGVMHPHQLRALAKWAAAMQIEQIVDLMAGRGILPLCLEAFTDWPSSKIVARDLCLPQAVKSFYPVLQADATDPTTYPNAANKLYVLAWPDFADSTVAVSATVIENIYNAGGQWILVLDSRETIAIMSAGYAVLNRYYAPCPDLTFQSFEIEDTRPYLHLLLQSLSTRFAESGVASGSGLTPLEITTKIYKEYTDVNGFAVQQQTTLYRRIP